MAQIAAIGWFVSPIIMNMINMSQSYFTKQFNRKSDLYDNLEKLQHTLFGIKVALDSAERRQLNDANLTALLRDLKDVLYEADDLLDDIEYEFLKAQTHAKEASRMVRCKISSLPIAKCLPAKGKLLPKLRNIDRKLYNVYRSSQTLLQVAGPELDLDPSTLSHLIEANHITDSRVRGTEIFGRESEKQEIVRLLTESLDEPHISKKNSVPIITAIVGSAGIGKTTLARIVYDDECIRKHFDIRMWVYVASDYKKVDLIRCMLESASESIASPEDVADPDSLERELKDMLKSKKFLLVVDDLQHYEHSTNSTNITTLLELLDLLEAGAMNSKVLVTTRMKIVPEVLNAKSLLLECLRENEYWSFFRRCAFGQHTTEKYPELQKIGMEVAKRLQGSPLAAKLVGAMLKDKLEVDHWMEIKRKFSYEKDLRLHYELLPNYLKPCFAYCGIFPRGWKINRDYLVQLWIAQGYIKPKSGEAPDMVATGKSYFDDLISRSFFNIVKDDSSTFFVIPDVMHDLADYISLNECFRIENNKDQSYPLMHHLSLSTENKEGLGDAVAGLKTNNILKNLRTLFVFNKGMYQTIPFSHIRDLLKELKSIRALILENLDIEVLPKNFSHLIHLRYLCIQTNSTFTLPESICGMYNLQTLIALGRCILPKNLSHLINFGKLTFIQGGLFFGSKKHQETQSVASFRMEALSSSPQQVRFFMASSILPLKVPWLQIKHIGEVETLKLTNCKDENMPPQGLSTFNSLKRLLIQDSSRLLASENLRDGNNEEQGMGILPSSLEYLHIYKCGLTDRWLSRCLQGLTSLSRLEISCCTPLTSIPLAQVLQALTVLYNLMINNCQNFTSLEGINALSSLRELKILHCPKLESLPEQGLPASIMSLQIYGCGPGLMQQLEQQEGPQWSKISTVPRIVLRS